MAIFKAYDIRGIYGKEFGEEEAYRIGYFLPRLLKTDKVLVGRDTRLSSHEIFSSLSRGIMDAGADVYDLGLCTTPYVYFATVRYGFDASVQITASHNAKEYNGFKISKTGALPVGGDTGLRDLEEMVLNREVVVQKKCGKIFDFGDKKEDYIAFFKEHFPDRSNLKIAVDCSNGMASLFIKELLGDQTIYLYDHLDGSFPNHEPNPLLEENTEDLKKAVLQHRCDIGIIFDGDADRVIFIDEKGRFISPDLMTGILGRYYKNVGGTVLYDIRSSKSMSDYLKKLGFQTYMWKVGHAFAKMKMRELNAVFGGELAGHYYFRDFFNCDSAIFACLAVLQVLSSDKNHTISQMIDTFRPAVFSGELNFTVSDKKMAMERVTEYFSSHEKVLASYGFDGVRVEFADWWYNIRPSNTEPYLRLVVEAENEPLLRNRLDMMKKLIHE